MFKTVLSKLFSICLVALAAASSSYADLTFKTLDGEEGRLVIASNAIDLNSDKALFVETIRDNYKGIPFCDLNPNFKSVEDVNDWLDAAFDEEAQEIKEGAAQGTIYYVRAFVGENLVGFASFQIESSEANAVYVRQMAIDPKYQRKGIGRHLLFSIKNDGYLLPRTKTIYLITRYVNEKAINFYKKNGFIFSKYMHEGYDPNKYIGLEWHAASIKVKQE